MLVLDTSVLVGSLTGEKLAFPALRRSIDAGRVPLVTSLVLYEWRRGPRLPEELQIQEALLPKESYIAFGAEEAMVGARLYRAVRRPRARETDIAIAACAIVRDAELWTLNPADFRDIPGLRLYQP